jgi:hypothetical protein
MRARLPPAAPTTQLSIARMHVGRPITRSVRSTGRPPLTTETFELVPPHSITIASRTASWCSAAATPAAGPEPTVSDGRRRNSETLIAPPSPRSTRSGTRRSARASASSTCAAVRSTTGRMLALIAALTVRVSSPYVPLSSWPAQTGSPARRARSATVSSSDGSSTANAPLTAIAVQPGAGEPLERRVQVAVQRVASSASCSVSSARPGRQPDRADLRPLACAPQVRRAGEPDDADARDVALEQRVHRLRRRERDELDARALVSELGEQVVQHVCDAGRDALGRRVRRGHRRARAKLERRRVDSDGLRERPADVDPDAQAAVHARAASSARRRSGSHANMYAAPTA